MHEEAASDTARDMDSHAGGQRDTMLAEGRNSRASSGLPKKRGTGEKKKEKQRLAGSGGGI